VGAAGTRDHPAATLRRLRTVEPPVTRDRQLAALLRRAQWLLDDVAHEVAAGRCGDSERSAVADVLDGLAAALRGEELPPEVVDGGRAKL
jgi:hypothetical protein